MSHPEHQRPIPIVYFCKAPGCAWERTEPPRTAHYPQALRDLALDYDHHEATTHADSPYSGLDTRLGVPHAIDPD